MDLQKERAFSSAFFLYVDIGAIRSEEDSKKYNQKGFLQHVKEQDKMVFGAVTGWGREQSCASTTDVCVLAPTKNFWIGKWQDYVEPNLLAGAVFGGSSEIITKYHGAFYSLLHRHLNCKSHLNKQGFNLMDQFVMQAMVCLHPELVVVVQPERMEEWFLLLDYFT